MSTTVDILINPVTLRFSYHNSELIYMFACSNLIKFYILDINNIKSNALIK